MLLAAACQKASYIRAIATRQKVGGSAATASRPFYPLTSIALPLAVRRGTPRCTETGDAPGWQGAKREHTGSIRPRSNAGRRDAAPGRMQRGFRHGLPWPPAGQPRAAARPEPDRVGSPTQVSGGSSRPLFAGTVSCAQATPPDRFGGRTGHQRATKICYRLELGVSSTLTTSTGISNISGSARYRSKVWVARARDRDGTSSR